MNWPIQKLSDCCISITDGDHQAPPKTSFGIPFVTISNITSTNNLNFDGTLYVTKDYYDKLDDKRKARKGDVLYSVVGSFGLPVYIKNDKPFAFQRHIAILRTNEKLLSKFLYYTMLTKDFYMMADSVAIGAAQRTVTLTALRNMKIKVPNIKTQAKIISVLSSYDDLIENNQKQIKLLEEAAQRLYKEWFVDFRFPGHENTTFVDGLPEGWKQITLGDIKCRLESGGRPKGGIDNSLKKGIPSIGAENVIGLGQYNYSSEKLITEEFFNKMTKGRLISKDILIYKDGAYIGKTSLFQDGFPHRKAAVNEHVFLLHADDDILQYYIFFTLYQKEYFMKMQKLNKNSAQPGINSKAMLSLDILLPCRNIIIDFNNFVIPIMNRLFGLAKKNKLLSEARDRLLPKLMSGEIEV